MTAKHASTEGGSPQLVERLAELVGGSAGSSTIFGTAVERDGVTIVPVGRTRWGFGGGGGRDAGGDGSTGSGGGGGAIVRPLGFIEISGGRARFRRIVDPATVGVVLLALAAVGLVALRRVGMERRRRNTAVRGTGGAPDVERSVPARAEGAQVMEEEP